MRTLRHPTILCLVLALLGLVLNIPSRANAQPQRRGLPAPRETVLPDHPVEVPMHRLNMLPAVDLTINGRGPFRLVVDTGAAGVIIRRQLAESLDLPAPPGMPTGARIRIGSPGGASAPASLVYIDDLVIGEFTCKGIWTIAADLPFGDAMDGIIGMDIFAQYLLTYDYPGKKLVIDRGTLPEPDGQDILSYTPRMPNSHPVIKVDVDGTQREFVVDTGMGGWFGLAPDEAEHVTCLAGPRPGPLSLSIGGVLRSEYARVDTTLAIGRHLVRRPIVRLGEGNIIGTLFLQNFSVTIDGANRRIRLTRASDISAPSLRHLGIQLKLEDGKMVIWDVHPESHAAQIGLAVGDVVLTLDGQPAEDLYGTPAWHTLLESAEAVSIRFTQDENQPPREADLRVMELIP
jgi:predicted aspartyl protease